MRQKFSFRNLFVITIWFLGFPAHAEERAYFYCPRYGGWLTIERGLIQFELFDDRPPMGFVSGDRSLARSRLQYVDCSDEKFICLKPKSPELGAFSGGAPIVVPRVIEAGATYRYQDLILETRMADRLASGRVVRLVVRRSADKDEPWYSLTVQDRVGVLDVHFSNLQTVLARNGEGVLLQDISCSLNSRRTVFSQVRVRPSPRDPESPHS